MAIITQLAPWQQKFEQDIVYPDEGLSPTMYRDTVGLVTVGRGCQISAAEALTLPFMLGQTPATPQQITHEYARVSGMTQGHTPAFYKCTTALYLKPLDIEALVQKRILGMTDLLRRMFSAFDSFPDPAKIATLEMPWALKRFTMPDVYPKWKAAVLAKDWNAAAVDCVWNQPPNIYEKRNAARVALYHEAAEAVCV